MNISILTCPQCNAMVLNDAARCHVCDHVLDHEREEDDHVPTLPTDHAVAEDLETCTGCGETYRTGLVRCWNCGAFTRQEIKDAYDRMTADPGRYAVRESSGSSETAGDSQSKAPEATQRSGPWKVVAVPPRDNLPPANGHEDGPLLEEFDASDDDFSFELADSVHLTDAIERQHEEALEEGIAEDDTSGYSLAAEEAPPVLATATEEPAAVDDLAPAIPPLAVEAPASESPAASSKGSPADRKNAEIPDVAHSEATGGDVLLEIARQEETDISRSRQKFKDKLQGTFVVYCPMGCRIRVQERHRGKAGKCPKCNSVFFVPRQKPKRVVKDEAASDAAVPAVLEKWRGWQEDLHLHQVVPQKLRIKPDSLLNEFTMVDVAMSTEGLLLATLVTSPGFLGANLKKKPALRTGLQEHLKTVGTVDGAPVPQTRLIEPAALHQLVVAQPSPADVESLFGNIPVFGAGRIAVRLPRIADDPATQYLSFSLSEFRKFAANLADVCGVSGLGTDTEIPLTETYNTVACHYSEGPVRELLGLEYYQKDPALKLQVAGWRCGGCALVVSEDSRKKEKIGGLNGKGIASAKCPKCAAKFGSHPLYELAPAAGTPTPEPAAT